MKCTDTPRLVKKIWSHLATICMLFTLASTSFAQSWSAKVTDTEGLPIPQVNIVHLNSGAHAHSDAQGQFYFDKMSAGDSLLLSHIQYYQRIVTIPSLDSAWVFPMEDLIIDLEEVVIGQKLNPLSLISDIDVAVHPVRSSQDILQRVPGLFIGQHAGGGKAEQIFLRGFDIDHGTDIDITVDGLPVNMVSHAHGQGYADLHFVIPETVDKVDFGKGPYDAGKGNFATAGYVNMRTKDRIEDHMIKMELGEFDTRRLVGMYRFADDDKRRGYIASEYRYSNGPFDSPQGFHRVNLMGKYTATVSATDEVGLTLSHFDSRWDASGQIPDRAVAAGLIGRFGAIDDTEGGSTSRTNVALHHRTLISSNTALKSMVYFSDYDFELYSNFTFFLEDPVNADQIRQREARQIYGVQSTYHHGMHVGSAMVHWEAGVRLRYDQIDDSELSRSLHRLQTLEQIQFGQTDETNFSAHLSADVQLGRWSIQPSLRFDAFDFGYVDDLAPTYRPLSEEASIWSPKLNVRYHVDSDLQVYMKLGRGFHSNDTRVVLAEDPRDALPAASGADLGAIWKPSSKWLVQGALWYLHLDQEFVYVGDAGIVEPSGETRRQGVDLSVRYQPKRWLFAYVDANYAHARAIGEPEAADYIPLAPDLTIAGGLQVVHPSGLHGGLRLRHIDDRPANEDNSIVAEGWTVADLNLGYSWRQIDLGIQVENLFDTAWNEAQFATLSRLQMEDAPVEEIHFTPGTPRFIRGSLTFRF